MRRSLPILRRVLATSSPPASAAAGGREASWPDLLVRVWGPLLLAAPALAFPLAVPRFTLLSLAGAAVWLVVLAVRGRSGLAFPLPFEWPVLVLLAMALVGAWRSEYLWLTVPKLAGLTLGVLTFAAIVATATSVSRVRLLALLYLALGLATVAVAVLSGPAWKGLGYGLLYNLAHATVPRVMTLPGAEEGINPNALGVTTLFFLPVFAALACPWPSPRQVDRRPRFVTIAAKLARRALFGALALALLGILLLSQSRTSWVSAGLTLTILLSVRFRTVAVLAAVIAAGATVAMCRVGPADAVSSVLVKLNPIIGYFSSGDRSVIWRFALHAIREHPVAGVGFGAFREVIHSISIGGVMYPEPVPHAHNTFLQVALDTGIPGALAYVALLVTAGYMIWQVHRRAQDPTIKSLCLGLAGALLATHLFGITDAIALGAKVGLFFWFILGLISASYRLVTATVPRERVTLPLSRWSAQFPQPHEPPRTSQVSDRRSSSTHGVGDHRRDIHTRDISIELTQGTFLTSFDRRDTASGQCLAPIVSFDVRPDHSPTCRARLHRAILVTHLRVRRLLRIRHNDA